VSGLALKWSESGDPTAFRSMLDELPSGLIGLRDRALLTLGLGDGFKLFLGTRRGRARRGKRI
jgi:hypothetical protein